MGISFAWPYGYLLIPHLILHNQFFFTDLLLYAGKTYSVINSPIHSKHDDANFNSIPYCL